MQKRRPFCALGNVEISRDTNKERKMPKETTHRNPETRAARIERRGEEARGYGDQEEDHEDDEGQSFGGRLIIPWRDPRPNGGPYLKSTVG